MGAFLSKLWGNNSKQPQQPPPQQAQQQKPHRNVPPGHEQQRTPPLVASAVREEPQETARPRPQPKAPQAVVNTVHLKATLAKEVDASYPQPPPLPSRPPQAEAKTYTSTLEATIAAVAPPVPNPTPSPRFEEVSFTNGNCIDEQIDIETDLISPEVEDAVIKIQAGIRGYLTRTHLKTQLKDKPKTLVGSQVQAVPESGGDSTLNEDAPIVPPPPNFSDNVEVLINEVKSLASDEIATVAKEADLLVEHVFNAISGGDEGHKDAEAAVKIQAAFRGYMTRKHITDNATHPVEHAKGVQRLLSEEVDNKSTVDIKAEKDSTASPAVTPDLKVISEETLFSQIKPTERQTQLQEQPVPVTAASRATGSPAFDEVVVVEPQQDAAVKIQAAFRGYQVRKTLSRETSPFRSELEPQRTESPNRPKSSEGSHLLQPSNVEIKDQAAEDEVISVLDQLEEDLVQELKKEPDFFDFDTILADAMSSLADEELPSIPGFEDEGSPVGISAPDVAPIMLQSIHEQGLKEPLLSVPLEKQETEVTEKESQLNDDAYGSDAEEEEETEVHTDIVKLDKVAEKLDVVLIELKDTPDREIVPAPIPKESPSAAISSPISVEESSLVSAVPQLKHLAEKSTTLFEAIRESIEEKQTALLSLTSGDNNAVSQVVESQEKEEAVAEDQIPQLPSSSPPPPPPPPSPQQQTQKQEKEPSTQRQPLFAVQEDSGPKSSAPSLPPAPVIGVSEPSKASVLSLGSIGSRTEKQSDPMTESASSSLGAQSDEAEVQRVEEDEEEGGLQLPDSEHQARASSPNPFGKKKKRGKKQKRV